MATKVHDVPDTGNIPSCHDGRAIFEGSNPVLSLVRNDLTLAPDDFQSRLRVLLGLRGAVLTDDGRTWTTNFQTIEARRIGPPRSLGPLAPAKR